MNKKLFLTLTLFTLILTACASNSRRPASGPGGGSSAVELPMQTKLVLGTINLEETDYAVSAEQAAELLPMFYVLQDLNESDTAAQEEIDGLVNQIQETLTDDQVQAIDGMSLSMQDMFAFTRGNRGDSSSSDNLPAFGTNGGGAGGGAGGPPPDIGAGGFPGGGTGGIPGGGIPSAGTTSTSSDSSAAPIMDTSTPSALFDAVIELLQKKVQS